MNLSKLTTSSSALLHLFVGIFSFTILVVMGITNAVLSHKGLAPLNLDSNVKALLDGAVLYVVAAFQTPPGTSTVKTSDVVQYEAPADTVSPTSEATSVHVTAA